MDVTVELVPTESVKKLVCAVVSLGKPTSVVCVVTCAVLCLPSAFFPFMAPILDKMNFALFPISVTDFFYAALQTIKAERVTNSRKVSGSLCGCSMWVTG